MHRDIVVFTNGNLFAAIILKKFIKLYNQRISLIVIVSGDYKGNSGFNALFKYYRSVTFPFFIYKIITLLLIKILNIVYPKRIWDVKSMCQPYQDIQLINVNSIKDDGLYELVKGKKSTFLISVSCPQYISNKWLNLFNYKAINIHSSDLPAYAGLAPYYWVLANNEQQTSISVHYITSKFDAGNILEKKSLQIQKNTTVFNLFYNLSLNGEHILVRAFQKVEVNDPGENQIMSKYSYYSNPDFKSYIRLRKNGFKLIEIKDIYKLIK